MKNNIKQALDKGQKNLVGEVFGRLERNSDINLYKMLPLATTFCGLIVG